MDIDLTAHAGQKVRIGFYHRADGSAYGDDESTGWYIDAIEIVKKVPVFSGDFETGWADWTADESNGVWEVGTPTAGPSSCYEGTQCAGTVLAGNYAANLDSRLISAPLQLDTVSGSEELHLRFWHWFSYSSNDSGTVQISVYDSGTQTWSAWENVSSAIVSAIDLWSLMDIDLTAHAGQKVRIGFYHRADGSAYGDDESTGWYIDAAGILTLSEYLNSMTLMEMEYSIFMNQIPEYTTDPRTQEPTPMTQILITTA